MYRISELRMRIAISGASGFIGQMIVPSLSARGADLVLLGRDRERLASLFPDYTTVSYEDTQSAAAGADLFLNLAVVNNDQAADIAAMTCVNVSFAQDLAAAAMRAGVSRFVNFTSIHALDPHDMRPYAVSKRLAISELDKATGGSSVHLYLPAVIGNRFAGTLSPLNCLPSRFVKVMIGPLSALKPILHIDDLSNWIMEEAIIAPRRVILTKNQAENPVYAVVSRSIDLLAAIIGLLVLSPILLVTWIIIKAQGDGPAFFVQARIGQNGRSFSCYKFRTMSVGTVQVATHEVSGGAVTPLGVRLRRWKVDELPQLWNVLTGKMSLIGPRPSLPSQKELVRRRRDAGVLGVRPGISGLAQVAGIDMSDPAHLVEWDARYIAIRGLILDLKLIFQTVCGGGRGDRVAS